MRFHSTKGSAPEVDFKTALFQGLAPDGGLYMPTEIPSLHTEELRSLTSLSEVGLTVLRKWINPSEIPDVDLRDIAAKAFDFPIPLVRVGDLSILELFHGPTMAFKDIAARVLARLFEYFLKKENKDLVILVATSGDTGGAMAQAFSGLSRLKVVILYPEGKVSKLQEEQLTRVSENVIPIAIKGVFDDCQRYAKLAFQDKDFSEHNFSSANSINIGRLIPQIIYYVWAYKQIEKENIQFVVPSGNMGNATACLLAVKMGLPVKQVIIATNENDSVVKYYQTGKYEPIDTIQTLSNAMDIGEPSNLERVLQIFNHNHEEFCKQIKALKVSDAGTVEIIKKVYDKYNYLMDFHTAVAFKAAEKLLDLKIHSIVVSTASPLKFAEEMLRETGISVDNSEVLRDLQKNKKKLSVCENKYDSVKSILLERLDKDSAATP